MRTYQRGIIGAVLLAGIGACTGETAEDRADGPADTLAQTGSYYTRGGDSAMQIEGTATSDMLTAPAIITPVRLSLGQLTSGAPAESDAGRAAHKTLLADLVTAMQADMNRLGISDSEDLQALGDSVVEQVGGGTGAGEGPDPDDVQAHVASVQRLIALYESKVRSAGVSVDTARPR